jgi:hypothetical protein
VSVVDLGVFVDLHVFYKYPWINKYTTITPAAPTKIQRNERNGNVVLSIIDIFIIEMSNIEIFILHCEPLLVSVREL